MYITFNCSGWCAFPVSPKYNISNWKTVSFFLHWLLEVFQPDLWRTSFLSTLLFSDTSNELTTIWCREYTFRGDRKVRFSMKASSLRLSFQFKISAPMPLISFNQLFMLLSELFERTFGQWYQQCVIYMQTFKYFKDKKSNS